MSESSIDKFVRKAVEEGIQEAPSEFVQNLEEELRMDVAINESGGVENLLNKMIEEQGSELGLDDDEEGSEEDAEGSDDEGEEAEADSEEDSDKE